MVLFKKIQAIAGKWHDWQMLAEKAEAQLKARDGAALTRLLESLAERTLAEALGECRRITMQIVAFDRQSSGMAKSVARKKPVRSIESAVRGQRYA